MKAGPLLTARNNLAQTLYAQRDLAGARSHQEAVLEAMRRLFGESNPDTFNARLNLLRIIDAESRWPRPTSDNVQ